MAEVYIRDDYDDPKAERFCKLFLGGLNPVTSEEAIKQHFEQWGEIVDCVVMRNPGTKNSRGFGFITYKTAEMLDDAQKNRPHKIDDREVDSKRATPRHEPNERRMSVTKMFVGGLKDDVSEDDVKEVFGRFGKIEKLEMITDKNTGKSKGFCFITFDDFDCVDKCVLKQRISLNGKLVDVRKAVPNDRDSGMGGGRRGRGGSRGNTRSRGGFGGPNNGGYDNSYGPKGNFDYSYNMGGSSGPQRYDCGGHQGYSGGNQGGYGSGYGGMGSHHDGLGGDFNNGHNFGWGYESRYGGGPTFGAGFARRGAGPYGGNYGMHGFSR